MIRMCFLRCGSKIGSVFTTLDFHDSVSFRGMQASRQRSLTPELPADKDILNNVIVRDDFLVETSALSFGHQLIDSKQRVI